MNAKLDQGDKLSREPFSFHETKDGKVFIYWRGKPASILKGLKAGRFLQQIDNLDPSEAQLLMARLTGNFKRGNEG